MCTEPQILFLSGTAVRSLEMKMY